MRKYLNNIKAKSHPQHYLLHRYWGRKAHNVVSEYIKNFTKKNEKVLDPFMGSGVVPIECLKLHRRCIGVDLNPISTFLVKTTIKKIKLGDFKKSFKKIYQKNFELFSKLYHTYCPKCHSLSLMTNSIWNNYNFIKIRGDCSKCGKFIKKVDRFDLNLIKKTKKILKNLGKKIFYPKEKILKYVKRSDKTHLNMLFTERALIILSYLNKDINLIKNQSIRDNLKLCFSSMLSSSSRMIPGNPATVQGRSGWVVSKLWVPKIHTEKNIFDTFTNRFEKFCKGKFETNKFQKINNIKIYNQSSENLNFIEDNSIDYIFTDPPYGQSISYFGLSMFWNSWLNKKVNYNDEIIYDQYRDKEYEDYEQRIKKVFVEIYRVLKFNRFLSLTFHNRDIRIWEIIINNLKLVGFKLENICYQEQAVSSGTQGLNKKNTFKGDFVYNFVKKKFIKKFEIKKIKNVKEKIIKKITELLENNNNCLTPDKLYEEIIPYIVNNNIYRDENNKIINIENILNKFFLFKKIKNSNNSQYVWTKNLQL